RALIVAPDAFFDSQRDHIVQLVARQAIPAIYERREAAAAGGLMSYGANVADAYHQAGIYTGRILKGEKPADLPVMQPTKLEFAITLNPAEPLAFTVPPGLLAIAEEVMECFEGRFKINLPRRNFLRMAAGAAAVPAMSRAATAQDYPARLSSTGVKKV